MCTANLMYHDISPRTTPCLYNTLISGSSFDTGESIGNFAARAIDLGNMGRFAIDEPHLHWVSGGILESDAVGYILHLDWY